MRLSRPSGKRSKRAASSSAYNSRATQASTVLLTVRPLCRLPVFLRPLVMALHRLLQFGVEVPSGDAAPVDIQALARGPPHPLGDTRGLRLRVGQLVFQPLPRRLIEVA